MSKRILVNDCLTCIPGTRTFWHDLQEWFDCEFVGAAYENLATTAEPFAADASLIIRNGSYFGPFVASQTVPTISLIQDIFESGPAREQQNTVIRSSKAAVFNGKFTASKYDCAEEYEPVVKLEVIPLPVDFNLFQPGNAMGLQQALSLPDNCICWIGAQSEVKGFDVFWQIVRTNPDLNFVAVFKDTHPSYGPPNVRMYSRLPHDKLVEVIGACRVGLCTSRSETQHLAGIEMGACGLPMVAPPVGCYWKRDDMPGVVLEKLDVSAAGAIRAVLGSPSSPESVRAYWQKEFDKPVIRKQWEELVDAVEHPDCSDS